MADAAWWRVFVSWRAVAGMTETCHKHASWPAARQDALQMSCLRGVRYVTVQDPNDVVVGEYDRYTNYWRQYPRNLVDVEHTTEITDEDERAAAAWCTCGWSRFVFYGRREGAAEEAADRAEGFAREHREDPAVR